jgi:hypothetical protein
MIVVTAGTSEYRQIVDAQARKCAEFGYGHLIYDLGGLGIGEPYAVEREDLEPTVNGDSLPPATFKAALVEKAFGAANHGELVCWLDADCIPLRDFVPEWNFPPDSWDAAVTLRPAPEVGLSHNPALDYLNSGVVWIRNTEVGRAVAAGWRVLSEACATDQGALNQLVAPEYRVAGWNMLRGMVHASPQGARFLVLDAMEWNCWHPEHFKTARIAHFKRGLRSQAVNYL